MGFTVLAIEMFKRRQGNLQIVGNKSSAKGKVLGIGQTLKLNQKTADGPSVIPFS